MQDEKTVQPGVGGTESGMTGISERDESMSGGDRNGEGMVRCGKTMSSLGWFIGTAKGKHQLLWAQLRVEVMFYTILSLSFVFPHMDVISSNLSGFVKWQPDRETEELCFVARTWHSGTRCCGWQGIHWQTQRRPRCTFWARRSVSWNVALCHHSAMPLLLIITLYMLNVNQAAITLRGELELGIVEIWGLTLALPTCYPSTVKCPNEGVWNWIEMAGELKAHTDRLRRRKSKCSENKPQKLLQPLGNLLKAHKTKVCYNTWSYNGDPFHRFFFSLQGFFFFISFQQDVAS